MKIFKQEPKPVQVAVPESLLFQYYEANKTHKFSEFFNKKIFRVSDTPLTYRQINSLSNDNLIKDNRKNQQNWRKFSYKEVVYLLLVHDLKKFGFTHNQLQYLNLSFFDSKNSVAEMVLTCVTGGIEIIIGITNAGWITFYAPNLYMFYYPSLEPHIKLRLNDYVNELQSMRGVEPFKITTSLQDYWLTNNEFVTTEDEQKIINIIRDKNYSVIRIKKKSGEISNVYAEQLTNNEKDVTTQDLIEAINKNDFQDISIIKRDGKIVNLRIEKSFKI